MGAFITKLPDPTATQVFDDVLQDSMIDIVTKAPELSWMRFGEGAIGRETGLVTFLEEPFNEFTGTLTGNYTTSDGVLAVSDSSVFEIGDQVYLIDHKDSNKLQNVFQVTAINSGVEIAVSVIGSGADTNYLVATGDIIHINHSIGDNRNPDDFTFGQAREKDTRTSFMQWFEQTIEIGRKQVELAEASLMFGIDDLRVAGFNRKIIDMARAQYNAYINGIGVAETTAIGSKLKGLKEQVNTNTLDNRVDASAGDITEDLINNLWEKLCNRGLPTSSRMVLLLATKHARTISALRNDKVTLDVQGQGDSLGGNVTRYIGELAGFNGIEIVVDKNLANTEAYLLSGDDVLIHPKRGASLVASELATLPGQLGERHVMRSATTLQVRAPLNYHGVIFNLST